MPKANKDTVDICVRVLPSTGAQFVLDPSIVHPSKEFAYVFSIRIGEIREYEAGRIASLKDVSEDEKKHCLDLYSKWKKSFLQNAVEKDAAPHHSLFSSDFLLPVHRERVLD